MPLSRSPLPMLQPKVAQSPETTSHLPSLASSAQWVRRMTRWTAWLNRVDIWKRCGALSNKGEKKKEKKKTDCEETVEKCHDMIETRIYGILGSRRTGWRSKSATGEHKKIRQRPGLPDNSARMQTGIYFLSSRFWEAGGTCFVRGFLLPTLFGLRCIPYIHVRDLLA